MFLQRLSERIQKGGFWFLLILLAGILIGSFGMFKYHKSQLKNATTLSGILIDGVAYDLKKRNPF